MPQVANVAEDYSIRSPITGDLVLSRLALTGWGGVQSAVPDLVAFTDRGRLWVRFTASSNLLEFFRRSTMLAADLVCSGTVADGLVTLAANGAISSPISGTAEATNGTAGTNPTQDSVTQVVISYAHENDLKNAYAGFSSSYLDGNSKWEGQNTRFEAKLLEAKVQLEEHVAGLLGSRLRRDSAGRRQLADIADPRQLAPVHTYWTLSLVEVYRKNFKGAAEFEAKAMSLLRGTQITLDYDADAQQDLEASVASISLVRA